MHEHAVVDRIVDGVHAVLLVGEGDVERVVRIEQLPEGVGEGSWLTVCFEGERLVEAELDPAATRAAKERIADKMKRLRARGRGTS